MSAYTYVDPDLLARWVHERHPEISKSACQKIARQAVTQANPYVAALTLAIALPAVELPTRLHYNDPVGDTAAAMADRGRARRAY